MVRQIPLSQGKRVLVDDTDYDWLNQWKWIYGKTRSTAHTGYAFRTEYSGQLAKRIYMHRQILGFSGGQITDHINGNGLDNRRGNLRIVTRSQNAQNMAKRRGCKLSRFKGVWPYRQKWHAELYSPYRHYLGSFCTEEEAALAYNKAALAEYGEFAQLNPVTEEIAETAHGVYLAKAKAWRTWRRSCGPELKRRRLQAGFLQRELAELVGIHHTAISRYETGCQLPTKDVARKLVRYLDCDRTLSWLDG